jgi:site-specific DNA-cytosine methylase
MIPHTRHREVVFRDVHFFCGSGGGGIGFKRGHARIGRTTARFEGMGGLDVDPIACADFERNTGSPAYPLDLFTEEQFMQFHRSCTKRCRVCRGTGKPPPGWREVDGALIRMLFKYQSPHVTFFSAPCKGLSSLLNPRTAKGERYMALNELVPRGIDLAMDAWGDDPPGLIVMENVPRIMTRGRYLLDRVTTQLNDYGYAVRETSHNCGELGGLGQNRQRFLLVARHKQKIPPFLYEPPKLRVRGVGEVVCDLPVPGFTDDIAGPLHRLPQLQWITWLRLALIEAGKDWRHLHDLEIENGQLKNLGLIPLKDWHAGVLGVRGWEDPATTVTAMAAPTTGAFNIEDPRLSCDVDDRKTRRFNNVYKVIDFNEPSGAVTTGATPSSGGQAIADPRPTWAMKKDSYVSGGHLGIIPWGSPVGVISANGKHDNGKFSVQDPRGLPEGKERCEPVILSLDGTWHRPLTLMELALLQGYPASAFFEGPIAVVREHIGNSVPPPAAAAIADEMLDTLLRAHLKESIKLSEQEIWVRGGMPALMAFADQDELKIEVEVGP